MTNSKEQVCTIDEDLHLIFFNPFGSLLNVDPLSHYNACVAFCCTGHEYKKNPTPFAGNCK